MPQSPRQAPSMPQPTVQEAPQMPDVRSLLTAQLEELKQNAQIAPEHLEKLIQYLALPDAPIEPVLVEYIARLQAGRSDANELWQDVRALVDKHLNSGSTNDTMKNMPKKSSEAPKQNPPEPKRDAASTAPESAPQQPPQAQATAAFEGTAAAQQETSQQETATVEKSPAAQTYFDKTHENTGFGPVSSLQAADRYGLKELQKTIEELKQHGEPQERIDELVKQRDALARRTVLHGAARVSFAQKAARELARTPKNTSENPNTPTLEALQNEIRSLKDQIKQLTEAIANLQATPSAGGQESTPQEAAHESASNQAPAQEDTSDADTSSSETAPQEQDAPDAPENTAPESVPMDPEIKALEEFRARATAYALEKQGLKITDPSKLGEITRWVRGMSRTKRVLLYTAIGVGAAAGAMAAGFAGAALIGYLGLSASLSSVSGAATLAGLLGGKIAGAWAGHTAVKKVAAAAGWSMERAQMATGAEKAVRAYRRAIAAYRSKQSLINAINAFAGAPAVQGESISTLAPTPERMRELVDTAMRRTQYMPIIASVLTTGTAGALWHLMQPPAMSGHESLPPATQPSPQPPVAPEVPPQPIPAADQAGAPQPAPAPAPTAPPSTPVPEQPPTPTPQQPPTPPQQPLSVWHSTATPWQDRVPVESTGDLGSPLSVDRVGETIDSLMHAPTATEGYQDLYTKAAMKIPQLKPLLAAQHPGLLHDINALATATTTLLGANGDLHTVGTLAPGAQEVLQRIGIGDIDLWEAGKTYNLRATFQVPEFVDALKNWIDTHASAFKNPEVAKKLVDTIARHA